MNAVEKVEKVEKRFYYEGTLILKVPLVDEYRAGQPFTLKPRLAIALVFGFMDDSEEVSEFM